MQKVLAIRSPPPYTLGMKKFAVQIRFNGRIQKISLNAENESAAIAATRKFMFPLYQFEILKITKK